ncbi:hypothetical protein R3W88_001501 [Solanum pinnatisectum]|uniref:F-box domain-containing protein n=1 Tax=Solanum pinnatisectum TaxID=50273 RepID=A0AAV9ML49_9SOLN|nr:hypothetical protein R3W88_001501 [Solanum pinnatisectum]
MAMSKAEFLPEELIIDILYRLPVKSIGRCRCLSKHWCNFLSDPQSIKLHFNLHAQTKEEKLVIVTRQRELYTITFNHQNGFLHGISRKVVVLSYPAKNKTLTRVDIYSVRKGLWEKLENSPYDHSPFDPRSGVLVKGLCIGWLGVCISTNICPYMDTNTFWMMKEYVAKESWTKFKITAPGLDVSLTTLLCSIGDDDVLLDANEELAVYNMKENRRKDLLIDVNLFPYAGRTFVDSLISPYFGSETEG